MLLLNLPVLTVTRDPLGENLRALDRRFRSTYNTNEQQKENKRNQRIEGTKELKEQKNRENKRIR